VPCYREARHDVDEAASDPSRQTAGTTSGTPQRRNEKGRRVRARTTARGRRRGPILPDDAPRTCKRRVMPSMLYRMALDVPTIVSLAGALGVGSIIGQLVAGGKDRRSARAAVLQALNDVETARWAPAAKGKPSFADSAHALRGAALIAQIPRNPVHLYLLLAQVAHWESLEGFEQSNDPEFGGGISAALSEVVREAGRVLVAAIWSPPGMRWLRSKRGVAKVEARFAAIKDRRVQEKMQRARKLMI
jgi:hypothetical protein